MGNTIAHASLVNRAPGRIRKDKHRLLTLTVLALPFSYVPHELIRTGPSLTTVVFALVVLTGIKYRRAMLPPSAVEVVAGMFAAWVALRLLVFAPLEGLEFDLAEAATSVGTIIAGIILVRIGRVGELRTPVIRGLKLVLTGLLLIEAYQIVVGLGWLTSLGYADGFYYFTREGTYRPFGTFLSPTVFGAYLAIVGAFVVGTAKGKTTMLWFVAVTAGLLLTDTRAAWFAFAAALAVILLSQSAKVRSRTALASFPVLGALLIMWMAFPDFLSTQMDRLASVADSDLTSNSSRIAIWDGTMEAVSTAPVLGYGTAPFPDVLWPIIGQTALLGHAHSNYLQVLFMHGVPGLVLFAMFLVACFVVLRRSRPMDNYAVAGLGVLTAFAVDSAFETTWTSMNVVITLFMLVGLGLPAPKRRAVRYLATQTPASRT